MSQGAVARSPGRSGRPVVLVLVMTGPYPVCREGGDGMEELATDADIASIPKIELHVHYGGVVTEAMATELARSQGVDPRAVLPADGRYPTRYEDFPHFLRVFLAANSVIRTA